jgi:hypothetical protein
MQTCSQTLAWLRLGEARCLCVLGYVMLAQKDNYRSLAQYEAALKIFETKGECKLSCAHCSFGVTLPSHQLGELESSWILHSLGS